MEAQTDISLHEQSFIDAFIVKDFRERLRFVLQKRRWEFIQYFAHMSMKYLDIAYVHTLPKPNSYFEDTMKLLLKNGAMADSCYAMSCLDKIDGRILPLREALESAICYGLPSIISCIPGKLAYIETEQVCGPPDRFILFRNSTKRYSD